MLINGVTDVMALVARPTLKPRLELHGFGFLGGRGDHILTLASSVKKLPPQTVAAFILVFYKYSNAMQFNGSAI